MISIHLAIDGTMFVAIITACCKVVSAANRIENVLKNFPPHLHINGKIVYSNDFQPPDVSSMSASGASQ